MKLFVAFFLLLGISNGRPPECSYMDISTNDSIIMDIQKISCNVRTFNTDLHLKSDDKTESLVKLRTVSESISTLSITCKKQVVFVSAIDTKFFYDYINLEELTMVYCKFFEIPDDTFFKLVNIRRLTINAHYEDWPGRSLSLKQLSFSNLSKLEMLDLSFNGISQVPIGSFCSLVSLNELTLSYNKLQSFEDIGLPIEERCLIRIHHLYLDNNEIDHLYSHYGDLFELRFLSLNNNKIMSLTNYSFHGMRELQMLDLSNNGIEYIETDSLAHLTNLRSLNLANNSLTSIPLGVFRTLEYVLSLNMSFNNLNFTDKGSILGLIRLIVLDLSHNQITHLSSQLFKDMYSLQVLYMHNCLINVIEDNSFSNLANLHHLDLSSNKLFNLTENIFSGLKVLALLNISNNYLTSVAFHSFQNCTSLREVDLSNNDLTYIPKALSNAGRLRKINLSFNRISTVDGSSLGGMRWLMGLDLSHNEITEINENSFRLLPHLEIIDVSFNFVPLITNQTLGTVKNITVLNLNNNKLKSLYGMLLNAHKLSELNASFNLIEWFDYAVLPQNIKIIDISKNKIRKLGNHYRLQDQMKLYNLDASSNLITEIDSLSVPNSIRKLYLKGNLIDFVAFNTFVDKKFVTLIDLSDNRITLLSESSIRVPSVMGVFRESQPVIYLFENPLECDCEADWLIKALRKSLPKNQPFNLPRIGNPEITQCKLPGIWENQMVPILTVSRNNFLCTYRRHCFSVCHCCEFDACDCEQMCPQECSCYHDHTWEHNIVDCGESNLNRIPKGLPMDVTESYIDGNNITVLAAHFLIGKKNLHTLYLNHSLIEYIESKAFNGLYKLLILRLDNNLIRALEGDEFKNLDSLKELYLNNNKLEFIHESIFQNLYSLKLLTLDNNILGNYPIWNIKLASNIGILTLNNNNIICDCQYFSRLENLKDSNGLISLKHITCNLRRFPNSKYNAAKFLSECRVSMTSKNLNQIITYDYMLLFGIGSFFALILMFGVAISFACRHRIKSICSFCSKILPKKYPKRNIKLFDFFISFSTKDTSWVYECIIPELELRGYSTYVSQKENYSELSNSSLEEIVDSIDCCRRVLLILSKNYLKEEWNNINFRTIHIQASKKFKEAQLSCIFIDKVRLTELESELLLIVKKCQSSLYACQPNFWTDLDKLLPYKNKYTKSCKLIENSCNLPLLNSKDYGQYLTSYSKDYKLNYGKPKIYVNKSVSNDDNKENGYWNSVEDSEFGNHIEEEENAYMSISDCNEDLYKNLNSRDHCKTADTDNKNYIVSIENKKWINNPKVPVNSSQQLFFV